MATLREKEYVRNLLDAKIDNKRDAIQTVIQTLQGRLTRLSTALADNSSFNSLGEVQGLGSELDRMTGELSTLLDLRKNIGNMMDEAKIMSELYSD